MAKTPDMKENIISKTCLTVNLSDKYGNQVEN